MNACRSARSLFTAAVLGLLGGPGVAGAQSTVTLTAADGTAGDKFGISVGLDGDALIVGASGVNSGIIPDTGAAYLLRWNGTQWLPEQKLTVAGSVALDRFGLEVSLRGDLCVVGAPGKKLGLKSSAGVIHVFRRIDGTWTFQQLLSAIDGASFDMFGGQFALTQDRIVVGVAAHDVNFMSSQGQVYVYRFDGNSFVLEQLLTASDGAAADKFGASVDIDGDRIVVGATGSDDDGATDSGAVYVFRRIGATWMEQQKLLAADGNSLDAFGTSVAVDGNVTVVGVPASDPSGNSGRGAAYVYRDNGTLFVAEQKLVAADGLANDAFGTAVDIDGDVLSVSAPFDDVGVLNDQGSAWLFRYTNASWVGEHLFAPADISASGQFGTVLAMDSGLLVTGAANDTVGGFGVQGSACLLKAQPQGWTWLGRSLPGLEGAPDLVGSGPLTNGSTIALEVDDARAGSVLALATSALQLDLPFKGGVLVPAPDIVLAGLPVSAAGMLEVSGLWPVGVPSGFPILLQAWITDAAAPEGLSATNAVAATAP